MFHLSLPATKGNIANHVKEAILDTMERERMGLLHAARAHGVSGPRVAAELREDDLFKERVEELRALLVEDLSEKYLKLAESATQADRTKLDAIWRAISRLLPRYREEAPTHQTTVQVGIVCDDATRQRLIAMREEAMRLPTPGDTPGAVAGRTGAARATVEA